MSRNPFHPLIFDAHLFPEVSDPAIGCIKLALNPNSFIDTIGRPTSRINHRKMRQRDNMQHCFLHHDRPALGKRNSIIPTYWQRKTPFRIIVYLHQTRNYNHPFEKRLAKILGQFYAPKFAGLCDRKSSVEEDWKNVINT